MVTNAPLPPEKGVRFVVLSSPLLKFKNSFRVLTPICAKTPASIQRTIFNVKRFVDLFNDNAIPTEIQIGVKIKKLGRNVFSKNGKFFRALSL